MTSRFSLQLRKLKATIERPLANKEVREAARDEFSSAMREEFDTEGRGDWASDLVETKRYRRSLVERKEFYARYTQDSFVFGSNVPYSKFLWRWSGPGFQKTINRVRARVVARIGRQLRAIAKRGAKNG